MDFLGKWLSPLFWEKKLIGKSWFEFLVKKDYRSRKWIETSIFHSLLFRLSERHWKPRIFSTAFWKSLGDDPFIPCRIPCRLMSSRSDSSSSDTPESDSVSDMDEHEDECGWMRRVAGAPQPPTKSAVVKEAARGAALGTSKSAGNPRKLRKWPGSRRPGRRRTAACRVSGPVNFPLHTEETSESSW